MAAKRSSIPIVDFQTWHPNASIDEKMEVAAKLIDACRSVGFVYIKNHSVPSATLKDAFGWSKKLFDLPKEQKMLAPHPPGFAVHRGYSRPGLEKVSNAMGDEDDKEDLVKNLRHVSDFKVLPTTGVNHCLALIVLILHRKAMKSAVSRTLTSPMSGFRRVFWPDSNPS